MRGFFGIGVEQISKPMNLGAITRTAHAFGAGFVFTVAGHAKKKDIYGADTSRTFEQLPFYEFEGLEDFTIPKGARLVGIELTDDAIDLPSFTHPKQAVYILGPEGGSLSPSIIDRCDYVIKIPTKFCLNVGLAAALVMYDRQITLGKFPDRPTGTGGPRLDDTSEWVPSKINKGRVKSKTLKPLEEQ